jgi:hypothetical protein
LIHESAFCERQHGHALVVDSFGFGAFIAVTRSADARVVPACAFAPAVMAAEASAPNSKVPLVNSSSARFSLKKSYLTVRLATQLKVHRQLHGGAMPK